MLSASEKLADYYLGLKMESITGETLAKAKRCVLDYLGCAIGGSGLDSSIMIKKGLRTLTPAVEANGSTVIMEGRAPLDKAAFINASFGHGLELDDILNEASLHPGVVVIPAALAVAEKLNVSGLNLLISIIAGYDLVSRLGQAINPASHYKRGFHPTSTCGTFAAALTAGMLLELNRDQLAHALGIAGSFTSGNLECYADGSLTKRIQPGVAVQGGVQAALLAAEGYTGPRWIFEGSRGFISGYSDAGNVEILARNLDYSSFEIMKTGIKPHACCRYNQPSIDVALKLVREHGLDCKEIEEVLIKVIKIAVPIVCEPREVKYNPKNVVDAQFSLPYSVAVALVKHRASIEEYSEKVLNDPDVRQLIPKIRFVHAPDLEDIFPKAFPSAGTVRLKDGREYFTRVDYCKGDPENPLSDEELEEKFITLARLSIQDEDCIYKIVDVVNNLEKGNVVDLTSLLGAGK